MQTIGLYVNIDANGNIQLPDRYRYLFGRSVRIILMVPETEAEISRARLHADIDVLDDSQLDYEHRVLTELHPSRPDQPCSAAPEANPFKVSVPCETDILSPIDESRESER